MLRHTSNSSSVLPPQSEVHITNHVCSIEICSWPTITENKDVCFPASWSNRVSPLLGMFSLIALLAAGLFTSVDLRLKKIHIPTGRDTIGRFAYFHHYHPYKLRTASRLYHNSVPPIDCLDRRRWKPNYPSLDSRQHGQNSRRTNLQSHVR